jgi:hypothetical protein
MDRAWMKLLTPSFFRSFGARDGEGFYESTLSAGGITGVIRPSFDSSIDD